MKSLFFAICLMLCIATTVSAQTHTEVTVEDNQTITSNKAFTGNNTHSGTETFTGAINSNNLAVGNVANKPATADAIQYVSAVGNDSNDGLSAGTAKLTIAAAQTALNASVTGGGTVHIAAGIYTGGVTLQSGVLIIGSGRGATLVTAPTGSAGFDIPAGTFHAHIEDLDISVSAATSTGITIEGNIPMGKFTEENTIRNVTIVGNGTIGEHGINAQGTSSIGDVALNRFDAVETKQIDIPFICHWCEGNVWTDIQVVNYSYNSTAQIAFDATGAYDQYVQLRVSDPLTGSGVIAYFNDGQRNQVQVYCESAVSLSQTCVKDAGVQNMYHVTVGNLSTAGTSLTGKSGIFTNTATIPFYFEFPTGLSGGSPVLELSDASGTVHAYLDNSGVYNYLDALGHLGILGVNTLTGTPRTWNLPDGSGNVVLDSLAQTLTNKTLTSPTSTGTDSGVETLVQKTLTTPVISQITNGGLLTVPNFTASLPALVGCGATTTCSNSGLSNTARSIFGSCPFSASTTCTVASISPAFTSSSSYFCVVTEASNTGVTFKVANVSSSSFTITGSASSSDTVNYVCAGN